MVEENEIQKRWSWEHSGSPPVMKLRTVSFSHLCSCDCVSCKLKPVSMKLRDYVAIWSVDMGSFQAYRGSYVLAFHQARHAHPTENLESRARAPRVWAGGTGRPRGRWLLLGVKPPSRNRKEQLSWRRGYLAKYRGCCYEEKEFVRYEEVEDWATTGVERFIDAEEETPIFVSVIGYESV